MASHTLVLYTASSSTYNLEGVPLSIDLVPESCYVREEARLIIEAPPIYMTTKLLAQQPSRRNPTRADVINQHGDQGKPRWAYLDDSKDQSIVTN